jgi:succinoglycan biosynthesis protein ExoA
MNQGSIDLTFVIPFRNEQGFLEATLDSILLQDLDGYRAEVFLLDGASTDQSRVIAERYAARSHPDLVLRVADNAGRTAPHGFNYGIRNGGAAIIGLGGAHTIYPAHYFKRAIELLRSVDASVVGGGHDAHIPSKRTLLNDAMALLYKSPFGSGVAAYHQRSKAGYVDTVYGGFYKRAVFEKVGLFKETLRKNQDNELNARVTAGGFKIYFDPALNTRYVQKTDSKSFVKRAFDFGNYHPTTWRVNPAAFRWRHVIPLFLVLYLLVVGPLFVWLGSIALAPLGAYVLSLGYAGIRLALLKHRFAASLLAPFLFSIYHAAYGFGTLVGLHKLFFKGADVQHGEINRSLPGVSDDAVA